MQVIQIIDKFTVIIDSGSNQNKLQKNNKVIIYEKGPQIKDLNHNDLGSYDIEKAELIVTRIEKNFSVAKHLKENGLFDLNKTLKSYITKGPLPVDDKDIKSILPKDNKIQVGDFVKKV